MRVRESKLTFIQSSLILSHVKVKGEKINNVILTDHLQYFMFDGSLSLCPAEDLFYLHFSTVRRVMAVNEGQ